MDNKVMEKLYDSFGNQIEMRPGPGGNYPYVPGQHVIDRMNRIFGGCWSTEIVHQEVIEDSVLVRVKVTVYDSATNLHYSHEGYGSSEIRRHSNTGKLISADNAYKSAETQAIKNACTRWGVGLFIEKGKDLADRPGNSPVIPPSEKTNNPPVPNIPMSGTDRQVPNIPVKPNISTGKAGTSAISVPPGFGGVGSTSKQVVEKPFAGFNNTSTETKTIPIPNVPQQENKSNQLTNNELAAPFIPPFVGRVVNGGSDTIEPVAVEQPKRTVVEVPKPVTANLMEEDAETDEDSISDVQLAAIEATMEMKKLTWSDFIKGALGEDYPNPPNSPDKLDYQTAVTVVRWGNEYGRQTE